MTGSRAALILWSGLAAALAVGLIAAPAGAGAAPRQPSRAAAGHFARRVPIRGGRRLYLECRGRGRPTVVLESGLGNAADVWGGAFLAAATDGKSRPRQAVFPAVSRFTRVCAYDRPGTGRLDPETGRFRPSRSDPVAMPRTALDVVRDLHALLHCARTIRAAGLRGPYVLVGHSVGGLTQRLYATLHPRQTAGLVTVDATPPGYPALLGRLLADDLLTPAQYAEVTDPPPPPGLEHYPANERLALEASGAQIRQAQADTPLHRMPFVFLSLPTVDLPATWRRDAIAAVQGLYAATQRRLGRLVPGARHIVAARRSGHYIQIEQPGLVVKAIRSVVRKVRAAP